MRITIFTSTKPDFISLHQIQEVSKRFKDVTIVAVDLNSPESKKERFRSLYRLTLKRGIAWFLKRLIDRFRLKACQQDWQNALQKAIQEEDKFRYSTQFKYDLMCKDVNGYETQQLIESTKPDILIQCGAGILKKNIFNIPHIATLNVHGAIAPKLRGGSSVFWAYYYGKADWLGVTVHQIDKGIDTGPVFAREGMAYIPGIHPAIKLVENALLGAKLLCEVLVRIESGDTKSYRPSEESVYLGFYSSTQYKALQKNNWYPVDATTFSK